MENNTNIRPLYEYKSLSYSKDLILENINKKQPLILSGIFQSAGELNENGRVYPKEILAREIDKFQEKIQEGRAYGALDHPESSLVTLSDAAILIKELIWNDNNVMGKLEVLNTTKGKDLKAILESGGSIGVSSRALGSTSRTSSGSEQVNSDLSLITWDIVSDPSVKKAILTESYIPKKYFYDNKINRDMVIKQLLTDIIEFK